MVKESHQCDIHSLSYQRMPSDWLLFHLNSYTILSEMQSLAAPQKMCVGSGYLTECTLIIVSFFHFACKLNFNQYAQPALS